MMDTVSFAFQLTYACPLSCSHCCFSAGPRDRRRLSPNLVAETISWLPEGVKLVCFTGGEPFLHLDDLASFVAAARAQGKASRVVTSGYFGKSRIVAERKIGRLVDAGLDELSLSWDDFHEQHVTFDTLCNVVAAARKFAGLAVAINIVQGQESRWTAARLRDSLDLGDAVVCESPINLTGRAAEEHRGGLRSDKVLGPCPHVLTGPALSATGKLLACCGVLADTDRLCISQRFTPSRLDSDLAEARRSVLFTWLHLRGPYAILEWMAEAYGVAIPPRDQVGGNCQACQHLFAPEMAAAVDAALCDKAVEVAGERQLLDCLGLGDPRSILSLWLGRIPLAGEGPTRAAPS